MNSKDSTKRFSDCASEYVKYRPSYPKEIILYLSDNHALRPTHVVADIGSGTGKLSEVFLRNGNTVYCVEPNAHMRAAAEDALYDYSQFKSIPGSAEQTRLPNAAVDFITVGQAFHWFDVEKTKSEFQRISKPDAMAVLIWNTRVQKSKVMSHYETLLIRHCPEYPKIGHGPEKNTAIQAFFDSKKIHTFKTPHHQEFDFESLVGFLASASYSPRPTDPNYRDLYVELQQYFNTFAINGLLRFEYQTELYTGRVF